MAVNTGKWPSKRGPIAKIMPSGGCKGDTVPLVVGRWYDFPEFGGYLGNVGLSSRGRGTTNSYLTSNYVPVSREGGRKYENTTISLEVTP